MTDYKREIVAYLDEVKAREKFSLDKVIEDYS
jgi:hypothetical protein